MYFENSLIQFKFIHMKLLFCVLFFFLVSCSGTPSCIEDRKEEFISQNTDRPETYILTFEQNGETFYVFDEGIALDATADVFDSECNFICEFGGFIAVGALPCEAYVDGLRRAQQIWPE